MLTPEEQAREKIEAKAEGTTLSGVAEQSAAYLTGLPPNIPHIQLPLSFAHESTGTETFYRNERDPEPRSRRLFAFHQPETLAGWMEEGMDGGRGDRAPTLRGRLLQMPPRSCPGLGPGLKPG